MEVKWATAISEHIHHCIANQSLRPPPPPSRSNENKFQCSGMIVGIWDIPAYCQQKPSQWWHNTLQKNYNLHGKLITSRGHSKNSDMYEVNTGDGHREKTSNHAILTERKKCFLLIS